MSGRARGRARRLGFGLATLLGRKPFGFFIPYRHAARAKPAGAPGLVPLFSAAEPAMEAALLVVEEFAPALRTILAEPDRPGDPRFTQDWFPRVDAACAYAVVREAAPRRIVEIGSGHSTRFLARAVRDGGLATDIVCIDPAPRARLPDGVRHEKRLLQPSDAALVAELRAGDILFVDSSHVAMPGTDLDLLVGTLLPGLAAGVLLHLHDIMLPFPYPAAWAWRGYNESVVVAALLAGGGFEIVFSSHWVATRHPERLAAGILGEIPLPEGARETSLWLRRR